MSLGGHTSPSILVAGDSTLDDPFLGQWQLPQYTEGGEGHVTLQPRPLSLNQRHMNEDPMPTCIPSATSNFGIGVFPLCVQVQTARTIPIQNMRTTDRIAHSIYTANNAYGTFLYRSTTSKECRIIVSVMINNPFQH
jgi:hypothetical protein